MTGVGPIDDILKLSQLKDEEGLPPTAEIALADTFVGRYGNMLRYVAAWGRWMAWDDLDFRWAHDDTLHAFDLARGICLDVAATCGKATLKATIASAKTVAAVERLAKANRRLATKVSQWDADPWVLNAHGYIDLRTGKISLADPDRYVTKVTGCPCAPPRTPHLLWTAFLDRVTAGNVELQGFLQRYIGYCLTGNTDEQVFAFAYGTGANGKSTFVSTIKKVFGDYAATAAMSTFIESNPATSTTKVEF